MIHRGGRDLSAGGGGYRLCNDIFDRDMGVSAIAAIYDTRIPAEAAPFPTLKTLQDICCRSFTPKTLEGNSIDLRSDSDNCYDRF